MCLVGIAHRVSDDRLLVIAANRDEDYDRPSLAAHQWKDAPHVIGGRDALHGGSWLAITSAGRFAAVTNLRGAVRDDRHRSRGFLVRDFVLGDQSPSDFAASIDVADYSGFHLLIGEVGGELVQLSESVRLLGSGIHSLSNAPAGERWPKMARVEQVLERRQSPEELLAFLRDESDNIFVASDRYGTRCSTVIVASNDAIHIVEQQYGRRGSAGERCERFAKRSGVRRP